jgi:hypothetical protein
MLVNIPTFKKEIKGIISSVGDFVFYRVMNTVISHFLLSTGTEAPRDTPMISPGFRLLTPNR